MLVISHKLHCRLPDGSFAVSGGFAALKTEFSKHVKALKLCVPVSSASLGMPSIKYPSNTNVAPLPIYKNRVGFILNLFKIIRILWREIGNTDLVYAMGPNDMGNLGLILARLRRRPVFVSLDTDRVNNIATTQKGICAFLKILILRLIIYPLLRFLARPVPAFVTGDMFLGNSPNWSQWVKSTLSSSEFPKAGVLPSNLNFRVVFAGRLVATKNLDCLLDAVAQLRLEGRAVELKIIGVGPELDRLRKKCLQLGLSCVEFVGGMKNSELMSGRFLGADLFVLPSVAERQGKVLLEAMGCSIPVIASRVGGIPTVIQHGENGLLFEPNSVTDLASAIRVVSDDQGLRKKLVSNGYHFSREHTMDIEIAKIMKKVFLFYEL